MIASHGPLQSLMVIKERQQCLVHHEPAQMKDNEAAQEPQTGAGH